MKKIMSILICFMFVLLSGCSSANDDSYVRSTEAGKIERITVTQMQEMLDNKESFPIVFTMTTCGHCIKFREMLDEYLLNHQVIVYDVILDEAPAENRQAELQQIRKTFPDMNETPSLYLIKDGKLVNQLENDKDGLSKKRFDAWVQEYQLDAENKDSYKRSTKEGKIEKITVAQMQEKLDKKQSFPIVFTQTTCGGCKDFKKMLDVYLKTHQVVVYDVILDEAPEENRQAELQQIRETFPGMNETPSLYLIKDGKLDNQLKSDEDGISKERFDKWVQEYQMDAIK